MFTSSGGDAREGLSYQLKTLSAKLSVWSPMLRQWLPRNRCNCLPGSWSPSSSFIHLGSTPEIPISYFHFLCPPPMPWPVPLSHPPWFSHLRLNRHYHRSQMHLGGRVPENQEYWALGTSLWEHSYCRTYWKWGKQSAFPRSICCPSRVVGQPAHSKMLSLSIQLEPNSCCISSGLGWDVHHSVAHSQ